MRERVWEREKRWWFFIDFIKIQIACNWIELIWIRMILWNILFFLEQNIICDLKRNEGNSLPFKSNLSVAIIFSSYYIAFN